MLASSEIITPSAIKGLPLILTFPRIVTLSEIVGLPSILTLPEISTSLIIIGQPVIVTFPRIVTLSEILITTRSEPLRITTSSEIVTLLSITTFP